jgi:tRNA nucleotidyltransferase/poly(A) polymerase
MANKLTITENDIKDVLDKVVGCINKSFFKNTVYLCGDTLVCALLGKRMRHIQLLVDMEKGAESLANWLAFQLDILSIGENPMLDDENDIAILSVDDIWLEITSTDPYKDGKKLSFENVARMKDFTYETLLYNLSSNELCDPLGVGDSDLRSRRMKPISDIDKTIKANPRIIFSILRDADKYDLGITKDTWLSIVKNAHLCGAMDSAKIRNELITTLTSDKPSGVIRKMDKCGLLRYVLPSIDFETEYEEVFKSAMSCLDLIDPIVSARLSALYHNIGKLSKGKNCDISEKSAEMAKTDLLGLGFGDSVVNSVCAAIKNYLYFDKSTQITDRKIRRFFSRCGEYSSTALQLMKAYGEYTGKKIDTEYIKKRYEELKGTTENVKLPINGSDIINELHVSGGPHIGVCLGKVREFVISNPTATRDQCLDVAELALSHLAV